MCKAKILVVDDEAEIVKSVSMRLRSAGYDVYSATDGMQATNVAMKELPDLLILDIGMPAGSGHVVAERLQNNGRTARIPVIFLTARTSESDYERALENGVAKYITKPYHPEVLLSAVEELLERVQSS
ncbi:MAG: response regulator [bacterium]